MMSGRSHEATFRAAPKKKPRRTMVSRGFPLEARGLSDEVFECLQRGSAHLLGGRLCRNGHGLLGERIDALTLLGCCLLHYAQLHETGHDEFAGAAWAELLLDEGEKLLKQSVDGLLIEVR